MACGLFVVHGLVSITAHGTGARGLCSLHPTGLVARKILLWDLTSPTKD